MATISLDQFVKNSLGKSRDWDGQYGSQCVDYARFYVNEVLGFPQFPPVVGAADIFKSAQGDLYDKVENSPTGIPPAGAIVIWARNEKENLPYGHVAIADHGSTTTVLKTTDQNWSGMKVTRENHNYENVHGWLIPKNQAVDGCLLPNTLEYQELYKRLISGSEKINKLAQYLNLGSNADNVTYEQVKNVLDSKDRDLTNLKTEVANRTEQVKRLEDQIKTEKDRLETQIAILIGDSKTQIEALRKENEKAYHELYIQYDDAMKRVGALTKQLEALKAGDFMNGMTLWQVLGIALSKIRLSGGDQS